MEAELLMAAGRRFQRIARPRPPCWPTWPRLILPGRPHRVDAAACFRAASVGQFADVPCHAGMTSEQWLAAFPDGDALRKEVGLPAPAWPAGRSRDEHDPTLNRAAASIAVIVSTCTWAGRSGPFFTDCTVSLENNQQELGLRDGLGNLRKTVRLIENGRMLAAFYNPNSTLARSSGHLLVISTGTRICALDPWKASGNTSPILWSQDLAETTTDNFGNVIFINRGIDSDFRANPFGPVNARYVCFLRRRSIVAVDPFERRVAVGAAGHSCPAARFSATSSICSCSPPGSEEASVYRASDGQLLGTRKVPRPKSDGNVYLRRQRCAGGPCGVVEPRESSSAVVMSLPGRRALKGGGELAMFDPWLQKAVWPSCGLLLKGARVGGGWQPGGGGSGAERAFVLLALADGRTIADLQLEVRPAPFSLTDLVVMRMGDQYIVVANDNHVLNNNNVEEQGTQQPQGMFCYPVALGMLIYALDLQGKFAWPARVDVDHQHLLLSPTGAAAGVVVCRLPVLTIVVGE